VTALRVFLARVLDLVSAGRRDRELDSEIAEHLALLEDDLAASGMSRDDARHESRRRFGGVEQVKMRYREQRGLPAIDALRQDVRFALRALAGDRGFTVTVIIVLALGIGVNNMMFTIYNAHTLRGLPLADVDRVLSVSTVDAGAIERGMSWADFDDLRRGTASVRLAAFAASPASLGEPRRAPDRVDRAHVTADSLSVLGIAPLLGRDLTRADDVAGAAPVALMSERLWRTRHGADSGLVGREVLIDGDPTTIVGIVPDASGFPGTAELWQPIAQLRGVATAGRHVRSLRVIGRVPADADVATIKARIETAILALGTAHPETNAGIRARVMSINERSLGRSSDPAWLAFMAVGCLVALIACANVANLLLGRGLARAREIALRTSLGASRARIVRQLLVESSLLAAAGGGLGLGVGIAGVRSFRGAFPEAALPYWMAYTVDVRVLAALVAVAALMTMVFGLVPALHASRSDPQSTLRQGGPAVSRVRAAGRWTTAFLVAELALAFVMLANLSLSWRLTAAGLPTDAALRADDVMTATLTMPPDRYPDAAARLAFMRGLEESLMAGAAGTRTLAFASMLPLRPVPERPAVAIAAPDREPVAVRQLFVSGDYFASLNVPVVSGRPLGAGDGSPGRLAAVVNERLAARLFPGADPIGQRFRFVEPGTATAPQWLTIVGVAPAIRQNGDADAIAYVPIGMAPPPTVSILLRARATPDQAASLLRAAAATIDPRMPLYNMATLHESTRQANAMGRASQRMLLALTIIAVGLGAVGLYAVMTRLVGSRRREIGIRMAIGASPGQVRGLLSRQAVRYASIGTLAGTMAVIAWDIAFAPSVRAREALPGAALADPLVIVATAAVVMVIALAASIIPMRRAQAISPSLALGHD
jgi:putative ABC transport system permease protein